MIVFSKIKSIFTYFSIQFARYIDHTWRAITGRQNLSRSKITPHLYLGGQYRGRGIKDFKKAGVTAIVNMRTKYLQNIKGIDQFKILHLPTPDLHAPTISNLEKGIQFIHTEIESGGTVYIHCRLGEGRGPTMTIAYLMSQGMLFEDAFNLVKSIRPFIAPTLVQINRLKELEKKYQNV